MTDFGRSLIAVVVFLVFISYFACYLTFWWRVETLRRRRRSALLPDTGAIVLGNALFWIWSDNHKRIGDRPLSGLVLGCRVALIATLAGFLTSFAITVAE